MTNYNNDTFVNYTYHKRNDDEGCDDAACNNGDVSVRLRLWGLFVTRLGGVGGLGGDNSVAVIGDDSRGIGVGDRNRGHGGRGLVAALCADDVGSWTLGDTLHIQLEGGVSGHREAHVSTGLLLTQLLNAVSHCCKQIEYH